MKDNLKTIHALHQVNAALDKFCNDKNCNMEKNEIIEGNKLIAEFMEAICWFSYKDARNYTSSETSPPYHEDWAWLMPVVEKIESMGFLFSMDRAGNQLDSETRCFFVRGIDYSETPTGARHTMKIVAVWQCVVQFIKWHNAQQK